ncbi:MAG: hypothetical protein LBS89_06010 [Zoogloeaceae bacterium]|jgi:hypothetical protein|nr:hypothetical protein [Zoogloeaceae bacterium]
MNKPWMKRGARGMLLAIVVVFPLIFFFGEWTSRRAQFDAKVKSAQLQVDHVSKAAIERSTRIWNQYEQALDAAGWTTLFDLARLEADTDMAQSKAIIQRSEAALDIVEREIEDTLRNMEQRIRQMPVSEGVRARVLKDFNEGRRNNTGKTVVALYREMFSEYKHLIDLLSVREKWTVQNSELAFHHDADADLYTAIFEKIDSIQQRMDNLSEQGRVKVDDALRDIKCREIPAPCL